MAGRFRDSSRAGQRVLKTSRSELVINGARILFWVTVLITFVLAEIPPSQAPEIFPWDKAEHFTAFYVLSCLALFAYPRAPLHIIGLWLSLFGATIEIVQALPFVHRDCDIMDWFADMIGVACAFAPTFLDQWRKVSADGGTRS
jgi:VanZ family protein